MYKYAAIFCFAELSCTVPFYAFLNMHLTGILNPVKKQKSKAYVET